MANDRGSIGADSRKYGVPLLSRWTVEDTTGVPVDQATRTAPDDPENSRSGPLSSRSA